MSLPVTILVVDDEPQIRRFMRTALNASNYKVLEAETGKAALERIALDMPQLVILDLGLPDMDGIEVIRRAREWTNTPIIVLSVRDNEGEKIRALDTGADDYITKPFGVGELLARIRAVLRHSSSEGTEPVVEVGGLTIDFGRRRVIREGVEIHLTPKEYEILRQLALHVGKVLTHTFLLKNVWGSAFVSQSQYLRVFIGSLRQKIEPDSTRPRYIITEPAVGYRLVDQ